MSCYKDRFDFAKRTIDLYKKADANGLRKNCEFTSVVGALLNVFSCIYPNGKLVLDPDSLLSHIDDVPHYGECNMGKSKEDLEYYLKNIRDGLAHKTENNFDNFYVEKDEIVSITISSNKKRKRNGTDGNKNNLAFNRFDLEKILELLEREIKKCYNDSD